MFTFEDEEYSESENHVSVNLKPDSEFAAADGLSPQSTASPIPEVSVSDGECVSVSITMCARVRVCV